MTTAQYNLLAYANTSLPAGTHTLQMGVGNRFDNFDYAIYT
jgi:hypothetical protein